MNSRNRRTSREEERGKKRGSVHTGQQEEVEEEEKRERRERERGRGEQIRIRKRFIAPW